MNYIANIGASPFNPVHDILFSQNMSSFKFSISKPKPLNIRYKSITNFANHLSSSVFAPYVRSVPPWLNSSPPVDLSLSKGGKTSTPPITYQQQFAETINTNYANHTLCFTDGSKTANATSCAFSLDGTISSTQSFLSFRLS
ncbi:hypothetical protein M8J77_020917 [Diaphorina citri]|nr:hypothetical protein M8J77_020917 [Diaphorina citri]